MENESESMEVKSIGIKLLKHPDKNVRIHTELQIKELMRSLEMFGQTRPAVIDENNVILVGNGMVMAMQKLNRKKVYVIKKLGLTEEEKRKLMLSDNKIYDLGRDDATVTSEWLNSFKDLDIPGFDENILKQIVNNSIDLENSLGNYGKLSDETADKIKNAKLKAGLTGRKLTCPKCGEVIWV